MSPDPLFYLVASVAVICFGLAKGGFVGIGFLATPLLALVVPPMQAVTILLPIMLVQDAVSTVAATNALLRQYPDVGVPYAMMVVYASAYPCPDLRAATPISGPAGLAP